MRSAELLIVFQVVVAACCVRDANLLGALFRGIMLLRVCRADFGRLPSYESTFTIVFRKPPTFVASSS